MTYQGFPPPRSAPAHAREQPDAGGAESPVAGYAGQPDAGYRGHPEAAYGGHPDGGYGGPPQAAYGGPPQAAYGGPPQAAYGGRPEAAYGGPPQAAYGGRPDGGYGGEPDRAHGGAFPPPRRPSRTSRARVGKRSLWFWSAVGLAVVGAVVVVLAVMEGGGQGAPAAPGTLVTTFMPNEMQRVPAACATVPASVLDQYLPGRSKPVAAQPLDGKAASQCSWTMDTPSQYRFMEVLLEAYSPSGLASGNGSATAAARDAFVGARLAKQFPTRQSKQPRAVVTPVAGLGQEAFSADQHYNRGARFDLETLVVRDRNVLVTVVFESRIGGRYGPDQVDLLGQGAEAAARAVLGKIG